MRFQILLFMKKMVQSFLHLLFPECCCVCGNSIIDNNQLICYHCLLRLPYTQFECLWDNPVEKLLIGRADIVSATSLLYFTKNSMVQNLLHEIKYRRSPLLCYYLGKQIGLSLLHNVRFSTIDAIVPIPLHPKKQRKRGYNQALLLSEGVSYYLQKPIITDAFTKNETLTQTNKGRFQRWDNICDAFVLSNATAIQDKHILIVDDVITTGATIDSIAKTIDIAQLHTKMSVATLACAI